MRKALASVSLCALAALFSAGAQAQDTGTITKAVGGYTFEQAAKEAEATKNFHSADGHLTFAIVTHTAGNGFFDPVYVGATAAGNMIGAKILLLGSESPTDDVVREIEILNQIIQDPTIDGLILTTPQVGAYNDIVKKLLDKGIPVATTNSFDPTIYMRDGISHTGQSAAAAAIGGAALAKCVLDKGLDKGSILFPSQTTAGNVEVNNRVVAAFDQVVKDLNAAGKLEKIGIAVNDQDIPGSIVTLLESRGDVVGIFGPNGAVTPAIVTAISQTKKEGQICAYGYDLGPPILEGLKSGALTGSLGQQPFLQGFWPVMQLYLQIDRGIAAANLDTRAQVVTKENVATVGKRFEN
ncbi:MAG: substrate-binding domain-containing protein [Alphaproteobacteria bacterium]|nr:MAG: substrate-binding domain-containing protein [Alphaproteobacteria bacterium]